MTTTSASAASPVASYPACSRRPAIRSESWTFIWQPNVSIRYFLANVPLLSLSPETFAFAFRPARRSGPGSLPDGLRLKHLTRRPSKTIGDRFAAQHPRQLFDPAVAVEAFHRVLRPAPLDPLLDLKVRVGARGNLRQVRDAEHLERGPEGAELASDHVGDTAADSGVHFVEDEPRRGRARRAIAGIAEAVPRRRRQRLDREHDAR